jgi:hypothetical protein
MREQEHQTRSHHRQASKEGFWCVAPAGVLSGYCKGCYQATDPAEGVVHPQAEVSDRGGVPVAAQHSTARRVCQDS